MKAIIINSFETYEDRVDLLYNYFIEKGIEVLVIQSDFLHVKKVKRKDSKKGVRFINVIPYKKNLSFSRLYSHRQFAKDVTEILEEVKPDLIYSLLPPNSLSKEVSMYKKKYPQTKVVFDIIDLWPETFPVPFFDKSILFKYWRNIRDNSLKYADMVITECDYFQEFLSLKEKKIESKTLYMSRKDKNVSLNPIFNSDYIELCYLGSINNIIDITYIKKILEEIHKVKPVKLHIIGDGEKKQHFIQAIQSIGVEVYYYGKIYNSIEKQKIFDRCHFGLNIMKKSVVVGLTMKSIDYFEGGLPIINNIPGDTKEMVLKNKLGFNTNAENNEELLELINNYSYEQFVEYRKNVSTTYIGKFSEDSFNRELDIIMTPLIK